MYWQLSGRSLLISQHFEMETITCATCNNDKTIDRFVSLGRKKSPALCKDCYYQMRAANESVKARKREYSQRPEVKERSREAYFRFISKPGMKERRNQYNKIRRQSSEEKERRRIKYIEYAKSQEFKDRRIEYLKRPEVRQHIKQRREKQEWKDRNKEYAKTYRSKPGFKEKAKAYHANYYANPEIKEKVKERVKNQIKNLDDRYIKLTLVLQSGKKIKSADIPRDLINLKRKLIELKRTIKQKKQKDEQHNTTDI